MRRLGIEAPIFDVARDGEAVAYVGRVYKRRGPAAADDLVLAPGERLTRTVNLAEAYDVSKPGNYVIRVREATAGSNAFMAWFPGENAVAEPEALDAQADVPPASRAPRFVGCNRRQARSLRAVLVKAQSYAYRAFDYLDELDFGSERYTAWFGEYADERHDIAWSHSAKIAGALENKRTTFDCRTCDVEDAFAYVYRNRPYKMYLCAQFWPAPAEGANSKAGTLVHEMSHFTIVAGTEDHAYGEDACKELAQSDPATALDNADNHEYFAENDPRLP